MRSPLAILLVVSLVVNVIFLAAIFLFPDPTPAPATAQPTVTAAGPVPPPRVAIGSAAAPTTEPALPPPTAPPPTVPPTLPPTLAPTFIPTSAPTEFPTPAITGPEWLQYLNLFRAQAGLPPVVENPQWSIDSALHSKYMSATGQLDHGEDPASPFYTSQGHAAGQNGNIAATVITMPQYAWAFNYWMSAAFHGLPMIDPELQTVGFGEYRDPAGAVEVTGTLDIKRGLGAIPPSVKFPIMFPKNGGLTWVLRYSLPEFPFALSSCPGYQQPSGPPIMLQIGKGDQTPGVTGTAFTQDGKALPHCEIDETNYFNPDGRFQKSGRRILDERDAVIIIPQSPLEPGKTYTVRIDVNGASYTWSFDAVKGPP